MTIRKTVPRRTSVRGAALFAAAAGLALACAAPPPAEAQGRPLVIKKRGDAWFLPGRVVPPGSLPTWATASANAAPVWSYDDRFRGPLPPRW